MATEVLTSRKVKTPFIRFQLEWMNDESPFKLGEKSRRIGWTYVESYDCTGRRFRRTSPRNMDYWFSSADESAAAEYIEYCRFWAKDMFGQIADYFTEQVEDPETKRTATAFCIRCPNGKRITAMTSNPRRFRSKGGDVGLDELAFHEDQRGILKAAQPCAMRGGWIRAFSTHNGESCEYHRMTEEAHQVLRHLGINPLERPRTDIPYEQIRAAAKQLRVRPIKLHRVTLLDAVEDGLVENINRYQGTAFTRDAFIENCRATCTDEDMWNEEYMCIASVGLSALLTYEMIERCERDECTDAIEGLSRNMGNGPKFIGMDFGRRKHSTVIWLLEGVGTRLVTRGVRWLHNEKFETQLGALGEWMALPGVVRACLDQTGMGEMPVETAKKLFGEYRVEGILFSGHNPQNLAMPLRSAFEDVSIDIPEDRRIREGLHKVRRVVTSTGNIRFNAEQDELGHADEFWALAMAKHAAGTGETAWRGELVATARKRTGSGDEDDSGREHRHERMSRPAAV